ncbi:MAG: response regulator transcription factor [Myxococcales bacterium]|nr:response regulator transcription factor [Myxococcales bacterium]
MADVLLVDDDGHIREVVRFALQKAGHRVVEAADGRAALEAFAAEPFDVVVLDIVMPEADGLEVCRQIRAKSPVPILFLSSRDDELDRVLGLELGADDYVTKPFSPRELVARVKAMLRRVEVDRAQSTAPAAPAAEIRRHGQLSLDLTRHRAYWGETELTLTVTEFNLLAALLRAPGRAYTRDELVERAWGPGHHLEDRTVDSHVRRIRRKFGAVGGDPVETVYGLGYRLRALDG